MLRTLTQEAIEQRGNIGLKGIGGGILVDIPALLFISSGFVRTISLDTGDPTCWNFFLPCLV